MWKNLNLKPLGCGPACPCCQFQTLKRGGWGWPSFSPPGDLARCRCIRDLARENNLFQMVPKLKVCERHLTIYNYIFHIWYRIRKEIYWQCLYLQYAVDFISTSKVNSYNTRGIHKIHIFRVLLWDVLVVLTVDGLDLSLCGRLREKRSDEKLAKPAKEVGMLLWWTKCKVGVAFIPYMK